MVSLSPNIAPSNPSSSVTPTNSSWNNTLTTLLHIRYSQVYSNSHGCAKAYFQFTGSLILSMSPLIYPNFILFHSLNRSCTSPYFCLFILYLCLYCYHLSNFPPCLSCIFFQTPLKSYVYKCVFPIVCEFFLFLPY